MGIDLEPLIRDSKRSSSIVAFTGAGATLAIINRDPTPRDGLADQLIPGQAGLLLDRHVRKMEREI